MTASASGGERDGNRRVLFLCTHNSATSQMVEGFLRHLAGNRLEAMSAGLKATDEVTARAVTSS